MAVTLSPQNICFSTSVLLSGPTREKKRSSLDQAVLGISIESDGYIINVAIDLAFIEFSLGRLTVRACFSIGVWSDLASYFSANFPSNRISDLQVD